MDVATIAMPADEARAKLAEYKAGLEGREPTEEDKGIVLGFQAIAAGKSLLDLHAVFRACPPDSRGYPRLAVARGHWRWSHLTVRQGGSALFAEAERTAHQSAWHRKFSLPAGVMPQPLRPGDHRANPREKWSIECRALVPLIPPNLRPARALSNHLILFEAEWQPVPPKDPMLLRRLCGSLYVVLAAWDLTELERAVLAGRLGGG